VIFLYYNVLTGKLEKINKIFNFRKVENSKALIAAPHGGKYIPSRSCDYLKYYDSSFPLEIDQDVNEIYNISKFSLATTNIHRHVINLNKDKYKNGKLNIFRDKCFNNHDLYAEIPNNSIKNKLIKFFYEPYFEFIENELSIIKKNNGKAFLLNAHSMEENIPNINLKLEDEKRPDFCLGTNDMKSITPELLNNFYGAFQAHASNYFGNNISIRIDDPFVGRVGLTRIFGNPQKNTNALLFEINQRLYFSEHNLKSDQEVIKNLNNIVQKTLEDIL